MTSTTTESERVPVPVRHTRNSLVGDELLSGSYEGDVGADSPVGKMLTVVGAASLTLTFEDGSTEVWEVQR